MLARTIEFLEAGENHESQNNFRFYDSINT